MIPSPSKRPHYISNKEFLQQLISYKNECRRAEEESRSRPPIPEPIGYAFLRLAGNVAKKRIFARYSYREDMIGDAVWNCVLYVDRFDENRSSNPFAYFTQVVHNSFKRTINSEGKESYVKYKSLEVSPMFHEQVSGAGESRKHVNLVNTVINEHSNGIIDKFENRMKKQKVKRIQKKFDSVGIEEMMSE